MKIALKKLLETLDEIGGANEELFDTEICEAMADALANGYVENSTGYAVPTDFGMSEGSGNARVREALIGFFDSASNDRRFRTPKQRLDAFQDSSVASAAGRTYRDYFGHVDDEALNFKAKAKQRDEEFGFKTDNDPR